MNRERIQQIVSDYHDKDITIGVLGSHSALEMGHGARQEGFEVAVICQRGREKTYTKHYKNLFDHVLILDKFMDEYRKAPPHKKRGYKDLHSMFQKISPILKDKGR